jgi:hypothetical protein
MAAQTCLSGVTSESSLTLTVWNLFCATVCSEVIICTDSCESTRLASLDIKNMYTNVITNELLDIINLALHNYIKDCIKHEIIELCRVVLNQNYFYYKGKYYMQETALAMGTPTSSIVSETYLQYL